MNDNYYTISKNYLNDCDIFYDDNNRKNFEIFEVISNVKVKSFIEYEEDKKNSLNRKENENENENKYKDIKTDLNNNINEISILSNEKEKPNDSIFIDEEKDNKNEKFIKDRDEYNIILKETFSKDRFSFRPTNKDSNETFHDTKIENNSNNDLDKKDFLNTNIISTSQFKINNYIINKLKNKKKNKPTIKNNSIIKYKGKKLKSKSKK
jgi:hypothetical protein